MQDTIGQLVIEELNSKIHPARTDQSFYNTDQLHPYSRPSSQSSSHSPPKKNIGAFFLLLRLLFWPILMGLKGLLKKILGRSEVLVVGQNMCF